jgi:hypothetical protein
MFLSVLALTLVLAEDPAPAAPPMPKAFAQSATAYFNALQDTGPLGPADLAARFKDRPPTDEAVIAETSLNQWKLCVLDALARWAPIQSQGTGTLIDGAFGRCGELERQYRDHLSKVTQGGRTLMDYQFARVMTKTLEDVWRPRLVAVLLDQALAQKETKEAKPAR